MNYSSTIRVMIDAVRKAGRRLSRDFGELEQLQVSKKGVGDFVTSADLKCEKILIGELSAARERYGFLAEESGETRGTDGKYRWLIDPVDGTTNLMHGLPHFCISVGLEEKQPNGKREIIAAVLYAPVLDELFWAEKGRGAFLNDRRIRISGRTRLEDAIIASYPWFGDGRCNEAAQSVTGALAVQRTNIRVMGSAALELAYVAAGKLDGFWHDALQPWDVAAGMLLVREAHGMVTDIRGGSDVLETGGIVAANESIHGPLQQLVEKAHKSR